MRSYSFQFPLTFLALSLLIIGCQPSLSQTGPEPPIVTHTYVSSDAPLLNPERGFFTPYELPGPVGFSPVRATGNTLVHLNIRLDDWREKDIPQDVLDGLDLNFADIRDAGVKAIIRFSYNAGPYPDTEPDASKIQVLRHINQLEPFLQSNADVIAWLEAGFIGAWGEWHTSTNGLDNLTNKREILMALVAAIPDRYVQVRYPANIIEMYSNPADAVKARVAHHNDCFLSSETDVGTYERDGLVTIERDQTYLAELTRFTPMSGETCAPNPPRSECTSALHEMALLHFSAINEAYHKGILRSWEEGGCVDEINNRMGYRISLTSADFNEQVRPGGVLDLTVNLQNTGFASIINERPLYVVLVAPDAILRHEVKLDVDPRGWQPGTATLIAKLHIPSNASGGDYKLALWLPDASTSLRDNPYYAIQFANEDVWDDSTGYNFLGTVSVDKRAGGSFQGGERFEIIESGASIEGSVPLVTQPASALLDSGPAGALIFNPQVSNDAENVYLSFDYVSGKYNGFQIFIDADRDPQTGYAVSGIGAETLFENHSWNLYQGSGSQVRWRILRKLFHSSNFDILFQPVNADWNSVFVTSRLTYTLK